MGLIGSQARMHVLIARKTDLETQLHQLNTTKLMYAMALSDSATNYATAMASATLNPDSNGTPGLMGSVPDLLTPMGNTVNVPDQKAIAILRENATIGFNAQQAKFGVADKIIEQVLKDLETEHKAIETEMDAVQKVIDKSVERGFKTLG